MSDVHLSDQPAQVPLGHGHSLFSAGLQGTVRVGPAASTRALAADGLDEALRQAGLRSGLEVALPPRMAAGARDMAVAALPGPSHVTLHVDVAANESCVLLVEDGATGALAWLLPDAVPATDGARALAG